MKTPSTIKSSTSEKTVELSFDEDPCKLLGKTVRLKSGSPLMTVVAFTLYEDNTCVQEWRYECGWFDEEQRVYSTMFCNGRALSVA